jgi:hypothetical protein
MLNKVSNSLCNSEGKMFGFTYEEILDIDFRRTQGKQIIKESGKTGKELKKFAKIYLNKNNLISIKRPKKPINKYIDLVEILKNEKPCLSKIKDYKINQIRECLKSLNLSSKGIKNDLCNKIFSISTLYYYYINNIGKLINLQSLLRKSITRNRIYFRGPSYLNRQLSNNKEDFYTCDSIKTIPNNYFFSYKDNDNFIYSFDIRSFQKLLTKGPMNPYNRNKIPLWVLNLYNYGIQKMEYLKYDILPYENEIELTSEQIFNHKVLDIFQKINELGHYTHIEWFTSLSSYELKLWYKEAEDIFNYRASLDIEGKKKIIPDNKAFQIRVYDIFKINLNLKRKLQDIVLNEINRFVTLGQTTHDRYTGSLYMLTALTIVSKKAKEALPWLDQI